MKGIFHSLCGKIKEKVAVQIEVTNFWRNKYEKRRINIDIFFELKSVYISKTSLIWKLAIIKTVQEAQLTKDPSTLKVCAFLHSNITSRSKSSRLRYL